MIASRWLMNSQLMRTTADSFHVNVSAERAMDQQAAQEEDDQEIIDGTRTKVIDPSAQLKLDPGQEEAG